MNYIFNIGFNKSGSTSLCSALNYLGIPTLHYFYNNTTLEKITARNIKLKRKLFHSLDNNYLGFSDFSGEDYYKILFQQYPNSKFILTTRNIDDWLKSLINHKLNNRQINQFKIKKQTKILSKRYEEKSTEIRNFFSSNKDQFLEMKICEGDGWESLCPFLGLTIPNIPFPHKNKTVYNH
jgi:hypothetical protein